MHPPEVILVSPKYPGNVGATARVMRNFGSTILHLVDTRADPLAPEAASLAHGAEKILTDVRRHETLPEAVAHLSGAIGFTSGRNRDMPQPVYGLDGIISRFRPSEQGRWGIVIGPEDRGLSTREMARCSHLATIPSDPEFPTLNLAQSVAIALYAFRAKGTGSAPSERATQGEVEGARVDLESALVAVGFLDPDLPERIMRDIVSLINRAGPTPREIRILRGVARKIRRLAAHLPESADRPTSES